MAEQRNVNISKQEVPSILSKRRLLPGDRVLWAIVTLFFFISAVVVYSSMAKMGFGEGSTSEMLQKHILLLVGGKTPAFLHHTCIYCRSTDDFGGILFGRRAQRCSSLVKPWFLLVPAVGVAKNRYRNAPCSTPFG